MAAPFETFGIEIALQSKGADRLLQDIKRISEWGKRCGASVEEISDEFDKLKDAIEHSGLPDAAKLVEKFTQALNIYKRELDETAKREEKASRKKKIEEFIGWAKSGATVLGSFYVALQPVRKVFAFTDAISKLNFQMQMLHFSSSIGVEALSQFGAIASINGGSAKTVAAFSESFYTQIENAKRGGGLGFLAENYRKFGFTFNEHETGEQYFERALQRYRTIDARLRPMFAREVGRERASEMIFRGSLTADEDRALRAKYAEIAGYRDVNGGSRVEHSSANAKKLTIATKTLEASWTAIKNQVLNALYPTIISITTTIQKWTDYLNKHPEIINRISKVVASIATLISTILVGNAIKGMLEWLSIVQRIKSLFVGIGAIAKGIFGVPAAVVSSVRTIVAAFSRIATILASSGITFIARIKTAVGILQAGILRAGTALNNVATKFGGVLKVATVAALVAAIIWAGAKWKEYFEKRKELQYWERKNKDIRNQGGKIRDRLDTQLSYAAQFKQMQEMIASGASASAVAAIRESVNDKAKKLKAWGVNTQNVIDGAEQAAEMIGVSLSDYKYNQSHSSVDNSRNQQNNYFISEGGQKDAETASRAMAGIHNGDSNVVVSTSERP